PPPPLPPQPGFKAAQAELRPHQIQDLAEIIGELVNAAAGYELVFRLRVELGGAGTLPDEVVQTVNRLLAGVAKDLQLK
ncbi:MAG TPA: hypothetical protein GXX25_07460, partial [Desulfotomaculum sp.]|nr:hypothetical protein [Desulfotomaculum sp.]